MERWEGAGRGLRGRWGRPRLGKLRVQEEPGVPWRVLISEGTRGHVARIGVERKSERA